MESKVKAGPKDVFLQLLSIITLYASAGALIELLFSLINLTWPHPLMEPWMAQAAEDSIRFSISVVIIVFPAYLLISRLLEKSYAVAPEKKDIRIRKWLTYLTLFLSALVLIGDLIALVNNLLHGDITLAFVLKVLSVLIVIGGVFLYYFWDIRAHSREPE